jgi:hypothetical protein
MRRRYDPKVPVVLLLLAAAMLIAVTGCERKIEGTVAVDETVSDQCFNCHNGQLDAMQGEWVNSIHASGASVDYTSRDGSDCMRCHNQDGFIDWVTTGSIAQSYGNAKAIGCFACHNPHVNGDFTLRSSAPVAMATGTYDVGASNLCARCHQSRGAPPDPPSGTDTLYEVTSSRFGPHHGPQGDLLAGLVGYEAIPGFSKVETLHRNVLSDGCVNCHMGYARTHDGYNVGGHSWNMLWEEEPDYNLSANCTDANCHGAGGLEFDDPVTDEPYDFVLLSVGGDGYQTQTEHLLDSLATLLEIQGIYNPSTGLARTGTFRTHVAGAYWNFIMIEEDRSFGIHNFGYIKSLLEASIDYCASLPPPTR